MSEYKGFSATFEGEGKDIKSTPTEASKLLNRSDEVNVFEGHPYSEFPENIWRAADTPKGKLHMNVFDHNVADDMGPIAVDLITGKVVADMRTYREPTYIPKSRKWETKCLFDGFWAITYHSKTKKKAIQKGEEFVSGKRTSMRKYTTSYGRHLNALAEQKRRRDFIDITWGSIDRMFDE